MRTLAALVVGMEFIREVKCKKLENSLPVVASCEAEVVADALEVG